MSSSHMYTLSARPRTHIPTPPRAHTHTDMRAGTGNIVRAALWYICVLQTLQATCAPRDVITRLLKCDIIYVCVCMGICICICVCIYRQREYRQSSITHWCDNMMWWRDGMMWCDDVIGKENIVRAAWHTDVITWCDDVMWWCDRQREYRQSSMAEC